MTFPRDGRCRRSMMPHERAPTMMCDYFGERAM
jgi:hypothetical protein